jgi:HrpA-like RNA helicase
VRWDAAEGRLHARETTRLGALTLGTRELRAVSDADAAAALLDAVREHGLALLHWSDDAVRLRERLAFLHALAPDEWQDVSDAALLDSLDDWLLPFVTGVRNARALERVDVAEALFACVGWQRRSTVDDLAPTHVQVPSGSRIAIDYSDARAGRAAAGDVRAGGHAARRRRPRAAHAAPALPRAAAGPGHARPRQLLAGRVLRSAAGPARPLPEALLAGGPAAGGTDAPGEAALVT